MSSRNFKPSYLLHMLHVSAWNEILIFKLEKCSNLIIFPFTGVLVLLLAYTTMGSILFMTLEGEDDTGKAVETAVAASKPRTDLVNADIRSR